MPYDPLAVLPDTWRRRVWATLAAWIIISQGWAFLGLLRPRPGAGVDFLQDWSSARYVLLGLPAYSDLDIAAERYVGHRRQFEDVWFVHKNAHPPTSVLVALPFGLLDYRDAVLAWNLVSLAALAASLALIAKGLGMRPPRWAVFPTIALLVICVPLWSQLNHGQLTLVLLLLLTGAWLAGRSHHPALAGTLLALATALKIFPGFLFLFYLLRRQWAVVAWGAAALAAISAVTAAALGASAYRDYVTQVVPLLDGYRDWGTNISPTAWWTKWFADGALFEDGRVPPVARLPALAAAGTWITRIAVLAVWAPLACKAHSRTQHDWAFGRSLVAMVVLSPLVWDHYLLLLLLPLALVWNALPTATWVRAAFMAICTGLWIGVPPRAGGVGPFRSLTVLSTSTYALVGLFALGLAIRTARQNDSSVHSET